MAQKKEKVSILYRLTRAIIKIALKIFFQKIDIRHGENIPREGPVLFVANHPNSIMDALVLGVVVGRKVNYIAHAGLFRNPLMRWFLRSNGVIPVHRRQDDPEKMDQNVSTFEACSEVLERGEAIGIFPEGTSDMVRKVKKVKTGTARILMETEARNNYELGVKLIPIGLHFYSLSHFRSRVMANFGEPIDTAPYIKMYREEGFEGVRALTNTIQERLEALTVSVRNEELDDFVRDVEQIYRDELKQLSAENRKAKDKAYREDFVISKAIAECVQFYYDHDAARVRQIQEQIAAYKRKLNKLHLRDNMLKESVSHKELWRQATRAYVKAALGFLPAVYGIINNFIPYRIAEGFAKKFSFERTKILTALLLGGGLAFLLFYALQTSVVYMIWGATWALLYLLSLPVSGFYALAYVTLMREQKKKISFSFFIFTNRALIARMRRQRRALILQLNEIRDEYVKIRPTILPKKEGQIA